MNTRPTDTPSPSKTGARSRWGAILIGFLVSTSAHAEGALVQGYRADGTVVIKMVVSHSSAKSAERVAIADCQQAGGQSCGVLNTFKDKCIATVVFNNRLVDIGEGPTEAAAQQEATEACSSRGGQCTPTQSGCDPPQQAAQPQQQPHPVIPTSTHTSLPPWAVVLALLIGVGLAIAAGQNAKTVPRFRPRRRYRRPRRTPRQSKGLCDWFWRPPQYKYEATTEETEEAQRHLEAAWDYIEDLIEPPIPPSTSAGQVDYVLEKVTRAAEHVAEARELDRNAQITVQPKKNESHPIRWTDAARAILFVQAKCEIHRAHQALDRFIARSHLRQAMSCTLQALAYQELPIYHLQLAYEYAYCGKKDDAKEHARRARELDKDNIDAVKFLTALPNMKPLWEPPILFELRAFAFYLGATTFLLAIPTFFYGWFDWPTREIIYAAGFIPPLVYGVFLALTNKLMKRLESVRDSYWHFRHVQIEGQKRKKLAQLFEERWKREARRQW